MSITSPSSPEITIDSQAKTNKSESGPLEDDSQKIISQMLNSEDISESPIDINISQAVSVNNAPLLKWFNYEIPPRKMKITNTGHTVILSGKWGQERPYITNGPLSGKYVFSQMHLHWGINDMEGSEHTIDGGMNPGEMHVVTFKSSYLTQESALKETDGVVILVYIFKLQDPPNPGFQVIVDALPGIAKAHTSVKIVPAQLGFVMRQFESDYFMYRGSVSTSDCVHHITWLITRVPLGVSSFQIDSFRFLLDNDDELIRRNFRPVQPMKGRQLLHILPSASKYSTLLPNLDLDNGEKTIMQIYRLQIFYKKDIKHVCKEIKKYPCRKWSSELEEQSNEEEKQNQLQHTDIELRNEMLDVFKDIKEYIKVTFYPVV